MVEYETWIGLCFQSARSKGFEATFQDNASVVSVGAAVWQDRKQELRSASKSTAREIADDEITVR